MSWSDDALNQCLDKVRGNINEIGERFPHVSLEGKYHEEPPEFWTSGFWPGILWLYYLNTGDGKAAVLADELEKMLDPVLDGFENLHHDVGFMWLPSAVLHYRIDHNCQSRLRGLKAASHLAGRFNPSGNFIRAWNDAVNPYSEGWAIIDCMMNLSLLYWASEELKDRRFKNIAIYHTDMVIRNFMRPDYTFPHIVSMNPETGEKIENLAGQGKHANSIWSRGQAWAFYGFAVAYRETGTQKYLDICRKIANSIGERLETGQLPCWDYYAEDEERYAKDSSAAACTASAMLLLADLIKEEEVSGYYRRKADVILKDLYDYYSDFSTEEQGILCKGTVSYPDNRYINVPIIYGDYFFIEALTRLKRPVTVF